MYKNLFESIKRKAKQNYYSEKLLRFKYNLKKTWAVMKEPIGKMTLKSSNDPRKITVNKVDLFDQTKIAHEFNSFITNIGKNLASKVPNASTPFEYFVNKSDFVMETKPLSMNELKDTFYSLESNKSPGYDDINYDVIKKCFGILCEPLKYLFNLSIK